MKQAQRYPTGSAAQDRRRAFKGGKPVMCTADHYAIVDALAKKMGATRGEVLRDLIEFASAVMVADHQDASIAEVMRIFRDHGTYTAIRDHLGEAWEVGLKGKAKALPKVPARFSKDLGK